ncbi:MAG: hypothetical protein NTV51_31850 [Verrucomicrobia bacterium]|nr:hypothetical protein [Verrucomicrobiota bacterium]
MKSTTSPLKLTTVAGLGLIVLGIGLNVPFAILGATFGYPDILRQPAAVHSAGSGTPSASHNTSHCA